MSFSPLPYQAQLASCDSEAIWFSRKNWHSFETAITKPFSALGFKKQRLTLKHTPLAEMFCLKCSAIP
jgi:hypothetical protein